jgi:hypothetical protein
MEGIPFLPGKEEGVAQDVFGRKAGGKGGIESPLDHGRQLGTALLYQPGELGHL